MCRDIRIFAQPRHDRVVDIAHAALQRQKFRRDASASHLFQQKGDHVIGNFLTNRIIVIQNVSGVGQLGLHHSDNLFFGSICTYRLPTRSIA